MIKLILKLCFICSFIFVTAFVQAGIIPSDLSTITPDLAPSNAGDVSQDSYITYYDGSTDTSWDIAWASDVNSELFFEGEIYNTLFSADTHAGWTTMPVNGQTGELELFVGWDGSDILSLFENGNSYIHAFQYWNSEFISPLDGESGYADIVSEQIRSEMSITWSEYTSIPDYSALSINNITGASFDTFYFRKSTDQINNTTPVPEPSTIMIFALGLIALVSKKRLLS